MANGDKRRLTIAKPVAPAPARAPKRPTRAEAEEAIRTLLLWAGDDPAREGLRDTDRKSTRLNSSHT